MKMTESHFGKDEETFPGSILIMSQKPSFCWATAASFPFDKQWIWELKSGDWGKDHDFALVTTIGILISTFH